MQIIFPSASVSSSSSEYSTEAKRRRQSVQQKNHPITVLFPGLHAQSGLCTINIRFSRLVTEGDVNIGE